MTDLDRAALVEGMARALCLAQGYEWDSHPDFHPVWRREAVVMGDTALEEAARVAEVTTAYDDNVQKSAGCWTTGQRIAAAIRAMKGKP